MPDGSVECGMIIGKLEAIQEMQAEHARVVKTEIDAIKERLDELTSERNKVAGAAIALYKAGGVLTMLVGLAAWFAVNGVPGWVKAALAK